MFSNKWWSTKIGAKLLSDLAIFSIFFPEILLDFHKSTQVVLLCQLMHFLSGIIT